MTIEPHEPTRPPAVPPEEGSGLVGGDWPSATSWIAIITVVAVAMIAFALHG